MRFAFVAEKAELGVTRLCKALSVSRAGFYAWKQRAESLHAAADRRLKVLVHEAYLLGRKYYGSPRVHRGTAEAGRPGESQAGHPADAGGRAGRSHSATLAQHDRQ